MNSSPGTPTGTGSQRARPARTPRVGDAAGRWGPRAHLGRAPPRRCSGEGGALGGAVGVDEHAPPAAAQRASRTRSAASASPPREHAQPRASGADGRLVAPAASQRATATSCEQRDLVLAQRAHQLRRRRREPRRDHDQPRRRAAAAPKSSNVEASKASGVSWSDARPLGRSRTSSDRPAPGRDDAAVRDASRPWAGRWSPRCR